MKKLLSILLALTLLVGCSNTDTTEDSSSGKKTVTASTSIVADIVENLAGDIVDIEVVIPAGEDAHNYTVEPNDLEKIQNADLVLYSGLHFEGSLEEALETVGYAVTANFTENEVIAMDEEEHSHSHNSGIFEDNEVEDRTLSDWEGEWQSVYPYLVDGTLEPVMEHKAQSSEDMTAEDYYNYYLEGYVTDVDKIVITENTMAFHSGDSVVEAEYEYDGYEILTYESGSRGVRFMFRAVGETNGAPQYVQFSDHEIAPTVAEHFHIFTGDVSQEELWEELTNWPTYYPESLNSEEILEEMLGHEHADDEHDHDHGDTDPHFWFNIDLYKKAVEYVSEKLIELVPEETETITANTTAYLEELDILDTENRELLAQIPEDTKYLVTPHDAFGYFSEYYDFPVMAPQGISNESEVSNKNLEETAEFIVEHNIKAVFVESTTDPARMEKLKELCDAKGFSVEVISGEGNELLSDSLAPKGEDGDTFISMYKHNINLIVENLK